MLVLFESSAGYTLFQVLDDDKIKHVDNINQHFSNAQNARNILQLKKFSRFSDTVEALSSLTSTNEGKLPKKLKSLLKKQIVKTGIMDNLAVGDSKLGNMIKEKLNISCVSDSNIIELIRGIRKQFNNLVSDVSDSDLHKMSLGLAHSLSRYKMKFSADKLDTMIVQAISLLDDIDKELNNYMMRCREWYGWHFPELSSIVTDGVIYAKVVIEMGFKSNASGTDFSSIIADEDTIEAIKSSAEVSIGTEISELDIINIRMLCDQIVEMSNYRSELSEYLVNRMNVVAPNLSIIVGEIVGARLIAHAGSVINLAKNPSSTIQILGAEKALFRALKTGKTTPKYGLIYHSSVVSQAPTQFKGRASRSLAAKAALAVRCDALSDNQIRLEMSLKNRSILESRIRAMESNQNRGITSTGKFTAKFDQYSKPMNKSYNTRNDFIFTNDSTQPSKRNFENVDTSATFNEEDSIDTFKKFKEDKETMVQNISGSSINMEDSINESNTTEVKKKKKKNKHKNKTEENN